MVSRLLASLLTVGGIGCENDFVDEATGFLSLVRATTADPASGLRTISATRGWVNGNRVEYLDFGPVTVPRRLGTRGEALRVPDAARVYPMYFIFDAQRRPLFAKPAFDTKTGVWHMRGGKNVLLPTPEPPTGEPQRTAFFSAIYPLRPRSEQLDPERNSSDYQRPVIDTLTDETNYSGLWEVVEIIVAHSGYEIDDLKSAATIGKGVTEGKLVENHTGNVINCPLIDERTQVTPSVMANNIPRPRMEVWYRTKLGTCYLVNGWETIGQTLDERVPATDTANLRLFAAGEPLRVNTFDVSAFSVGSGADEQLAVTVPTGRLHQPTVTLPLGNASLDRVRTRYAGDDLGTALPRHHADDPTGYTPIVWLYDLNVPQDPPYQPGSYKDITNVDPMLIVARDADVVTRNIAVIGAATRCISDADCRWGLECNPMPDVNIATTDPPPGLNIADMVIAREGGPRCDVPRTTFGGFCAPGVSRCDVQAPVGSENEATLRALGVSRAGPTFTVHAELEDAEEALATATSVAGGVDPEDPMAVVDPEDVATAAASLADLQAQVDRAREAVAYYDALGFTTDLSGYGYGCHPQNGGFCQIRCDAAASSTNAPLDTELPVANGPNPDVVTSTEYRFNTEARCGGPNLLGYRCLPTSVQPDRQRFCLRECAISGTSAVPGLNLPALNRAVCDHPLNQLEDDNGNPNTALSLGAGLPPVTALPGQVCSVTPVTFGGASTNVTGCNWIPDFEPRAPEVFPGQ